MKHQAKVAVLTVAASILLAGEVASEFGDLKVYGRASLSLSRRAPARR